MEHPDVRILSIGCSCINRFQFDFFQERHPDTAKVFPKGLFDWNISSLVSTLNVLQRVADGRLADILADPDGYSVAYDALIFNAALPGFSFFHEDTPHVLLADPVRRNAFLGKVAHLAQPFVVRDATVKTHLVWSNLQPNLPDTVRNVIDWDDFVLTQDRYTRTKTLARRIFGDNTNCSFLSTPEDMDGALAAQPDVHVHDIRRDESYTGVPDLYEPMLRQVVFGPI